MNKGVVRDLFFTLFHVRNILVLANNVLANKVFSSSHSRCIFLNLIRQPKSYPHAMSFVSSSRNEKYSDRYKYFFFNFLCRTQIYSKLINFRYLETLSEERRIQKYKNEILWIFRYSFFPYKAGVIWKGYRYVSMFWYLESIYYLYIGTYKYLSYNISRHPI